MITKISQNQLPQNRDCYNDWIGDGYCDDINNTEEDLERARIEEKYEVLLETGGSLPITDVPKKVIKIPPISGTIGIFFSKK